MRLYQLFALSAAIAVPLSAQTPAPAASTRGQAAAKAPFVKAESEAVVFELATKLDEDFVFPDVGKRYAATLRASLAEGAYSSFSDAHAFAEAVTSDLQAVHKDRHLRLHPPGLNANGRRRMMRVP